MADLEQRTFVKGVNAATGRFDQPRGTVPNLSNLYLNARGALSAVPGGAVIGRPINSVAGDTPGQIIALAQYLQFSNNQRLYYFLQNLKTTNFPAPTGLVATGVNVGGGTLTPGTTYTYYLAPAQGFTFNHAGFFATVSILLPGGTNAVRLQWNGQNGILYYNVAGRLAINPQFLSFASGIPFAQPGGSAPTLEFIDDGTLPLGGAVTYGEFINVTQFMVLPISGTYDASNQLALFPVAPRLVSPPPVGGVGAVAPSASWFSAVGGLAGALSPLPAIIPFDDKLMLVLGNGFPLHTYDGAVTTPISNTFTAQYPTRAISTAQLVGDLVIPVAPNGFYYKCVQGGQTSAGAIVFPTVIGQRVIDGQASWECKGKVTASPFPPGAGAAIVYAGLLWVFNTAPQNTADGLDGPSALRASDISNPNSWNPLNGLFLGKNDGSQGMGLATFTIAESGIAPTGSLVAFKEYKTYQITGVFGAADFSIQQAQTDMGCVAPPSIQFISGYGIVRLTHLGFAIFNGVRDNLISEDIRPFLFADQSKPDIIPIDWNWAYSSYGTQVNAPPMYACAVPRVGGSGECGRLFLYDMVLKAWAILDLPQDALAPHTLDMITQIKSPGTSPITLGAYGAFIYRIMNAVDTQWQGTDLSTLYDVKWAVTSPEVYNPKAIQGRIYVRQLMIRGVNLSPDDQAEGTITVKVILNDEDGTFNIVKDFDLGNGNFVLQITVGENCTNARALVSGAGPMQIHSFSWDVEAKPTRVPPRLT